MTRRELLFVPAASALAFAPDADQFVSLAKEYIGVWLSMNPETATYLGEHRYDEALSDVSPGAAERENRMNRSFLQRLRAVREERLDPVNRVDLRILRSHIEASLWGEETLREREWNPMVYNPGSSIYYLLERGTAPMPERLQHARKRLEAIPGYLADARKTLKESTAIHAETAIAQVQGTISLINRLMSDPPSSAARERAVAALNEWRDWLRKELLPKAKRDFRIGADLYRQKLRHTLDSELTAAEIRKRGEADLQETQASLYETSRKLLPSASGDRKQVIRAALDQLAEKRPSAATILGQAKKELEEVTGFVRLHGIVTLFDSPLAIVEMPEFQRGVAVASCASPGPFEKNGTTFFNISPPPSAWTPAQVESYFREYNDSMLKNLVVHEAMPGHYLQRAHANRFQAPTPTRAVFSSGTFTEGWAVYAERVMAENGYGGPAVRMQQLKMRLRTIINALLDQGIHASGMTEQQAMDLMTQEGFQERSEAAGKWRRAMLTSTQLSTYFVGTTELDLLRDDYGKQKGPVRDWKAFHDRLLSFGSPAPKYVRELMGV